jgi:hypothetical protein
VDGAGDVNPDTDQKALALDSGCTSRSITYRCWSAATRPERRGSN